MLCAFNGGDRAEVPLVPPDEVRRHREVEERWKLEFEAASKDRDGWIKEMRKSHGADARQAKIDNLKISAEEKALLKNKYHEPAGQRIGKEVFERAKGGG